jgi:hypothetical protein
MTAKVILFEFVKSFMRTQNSLLKCCNMWDSWFICPVRE